MQSNNAINNLIQNEKLIFAFIEQNNKIESNKVIIKL